MTDSHDSIIEEEVGVLEAIYIHELDVKRNEKNEVSQMVLQLQPATGDDTDQQYVCMTLLLGIPTEYPDMPPNIQIKNPRGIGEEEVQSTLEDMLSLADERKGEAMLYELIELAKECLTEGNLPRCACMICLEHFVEGDNCQKTSCYHYFHNMCLGRYVKHALSVKPEQVISHAKLEEKKLLCPVCREEISYSEDSFPETPVEEKMIYYPSPEMIKQQAEMAAILERQRAKGGLIDLEAEKNKYLITADDVVYLRSSNSSPNPPSDKPEHDNTERENKTTGDSKHSRAGSTAMKNKGRGSRFKGQPNSEGDFRGNSRFRKERNRRTYDDDWDEYGYDGYDDYIDEAPRGGNRNRQSYERYRESGRTRTDGYKDERHGTINERSHSERYKGERNRGTPDSEQYKEKPDSERYRDNGKNMDRGKHVDAHKLSIDERQADQHKERQTQNESRKTGKVGSDHGKSNYRKSTEMRPHGERFNTRSDISKSPRDTCLKNNEPAKATCDTNESLDNAAKQDESRSEKPGSVRERTGENLDCRAVDKSETDRKQSTSGSERQKSHYDRSSDNKRGPSQNNTDNRRGPRQNNSDNRRGADQNNLDNRRGADQNNSDNRRGADQNNSDNRRGADQNNSDNRRGADQNNLDNRRHSDYRRGIDQNNWDNRRGSDQNNSENRKGADQNNSDNRRHFEHGRAPDRPHSGRGRARSGYHDNPGNRYSDNSRRVHREDRSQLASASTSNIEGSRHRNDRKGFGKPPAKSESDKSTHITSVSNKDIDCDKQKNDSNANKSVNDKSPNKKASEHYRKPNEDRKEVMDENGRSSEGYSDKSRRRDSDQFRNNDRRQSGEGRSANNRGRGRGRGFNKKKDELTASNKYDNDRSRQHSDITDRFKSDLQLDTGKGARTSDSKKAGTDTDKGLTIEKSGSAVVSGNDLCSKPSVPPGFRVQPPPGF